MNESAHRTRYETRLARVLDPIYDHLDEPLDMGRLAEIACLSPYHWHRIYQAMYGETVATTVRRLRLHRAAGYLANSSMPIAEIAERSGYSSLRSFSRTFRAVCGVPPARYRRQGTHSRFRPALSMDFARARARTWSLSACCRKAAVRCQAPVEAHGCANKIPERWLKWARYNRRYEIFSDPLHPPALRGAAHQWAGSQRHGRGVSDATDH